MICEFNNKYFMFDVTPIENLFIEEYMLRAPGDYVKVYLYGLRLCYHSEDMDLSRMSRNLGMDQAEVLDAFRYWERQQILQRVSDNPPKWQFFNLKQNLVQSASGDDGLYQYRDFNNSLQNLFGNRLLHPQDFTKIFDWIEVFKLPQDVVFMLVKHYVSVKGAKVPMNYLDKVAKRWAKDNINTVELAKATLDSETREHAIAQRLVKQMGMRRLPSVDEIALVKKWCEWGFDMSAMLFACTELTKAQSPSFAYLDKVLESHHEEDRHTSLEIEEFLRLREERNTPVRNMLYALGSHGISATPELAKTVEGYKALGFLEEALVLLTDYVVKHGGKTFDDIDRVVKHYHELGIYTKDEIASHIETRQRIAHDAKAILARAGEERLPTAAERGQVAVWLNEWAMPSDVVLKAAEYARNAAAKIPFMNRILQKWHDMGINTVEKAIAEHEAHKATKPGYIKGSDMPQQVKSSRNSKEVSAHRYQQRSYTDEELNSLMVDVAALED